MTKARIAFEETLKDTSTSAQLNANSVYEAGLKELNEQDKDKVDNALDNDGYYSISYSLDETNPNTSTKELINNQLADDQKVASYDEATITLNVADSSYNKVGAYLISDTNSDVTLTTTISKEDIENRDYQVIRVHDGKAEVLEGTTVDKQKGTITFKSSKFSTFAIVYKETKKTDDTTKPSTPTATPTTTDNKKSTSKTADTRDTNNIILYGMIASMAIVAGIGIFVFKKRNA